MFLEQTKAAARTPHCSHTLPQTPEGLPRLQISPNACPFDDKPINQTCTLPPAGGSDCWRPCAGNMANVVSSVTILGTFKPHLTRPPHPHDGLLEREALANQSRGACKGQQWSRRARLALA